MTAEGAFAGRVALVTGASGGIGAAICRGLAASGARVAVGYGGNAPPAEALAAEIGGGAQAFGADLARPAEPARLVGEVERALGGVDLLVANHGLGRRARRDSRGQAGTGGRAGQQRRARTKAVV